MKEKQASLILSNMGADASASMIEDITRKKWDLTMEPIGQKVIIPSSEDIVVAGDLDDNSLEKLKTRIFDETLDGVLSEHHVGEDLIDDFIENIEKSD